MFNSSTQQGLLIKLFELNSGIALFLCNATTECRERAQMQKLFLHSFILTSSIFVVSHNYDNITIKLRLTF